MIISSCFLSESDSDFEISIVFIVFSVYGEICHISSKYILKMILSGKLFQIINL